MEYKHSDITEKIIKAAMTVHNFLGNGFPEVIYQRALAAEFNILLLNFVREMSIPVYFKEVHVGDRRVDFLVEQNICVELKALAILESGHIAQAKNYLEAFNFEIGLLINFGGKSLEWKRIYNNKYKV